MNRELQLKLQAYLDGELSSREARSIEDRLESDTEAGRLLQELRWTRQVLNQNEPECSLPEAGEFYWGKIERAIVEISGKARRDTMMEGRSLSLRKWLSPLAGLASVALLVFAVVRFVEFGALNEDPQYLAAVESPSEQMGAFSFRSQSDNVFVIWLYNQSPKTSSDPAYVNDLMIQ